MKDCSRALFIVLLIYFNIGECRRRQTQHLRINKGKDHNVWAKVAGNNKETLALNIHDPDIVNYRPLNDQKDYSEDNMKVEYQDIVHVPIDDETPVSKPKVVASLETEEDVKYPVVYSPQDKLVPNNNGKADKLILSVDSRLSRDKDPSLAEARQDYDRHILVKPTFDERGYNGYNDTYKKAYESTFPDKYQKELNESDLGDLISNRHQFVPQHYTDLGRRRFASEYPYPEKQPQQLDAEAEAKLNLAVKEAIQKVADAERIRPVQASPNVVLAVARQSALLAQSKPLDRTVDRVRNDILRSGDYWNAIWKEEVPNPSSGNPLRSDKHIESVKVKIMPGSKLYKLVSVAKNISPRLLYIVNNNKES